MNRSLLECPHCGSSNIRRSQRTSAGEYLSALWGQYPFRCQDCSQRSSLNLLLLSKLTYAKCPRCLSMDLTSWEPKHYHIPGWKKLLLRLGARRYRCAPCRYNFVSFRRSEAHKPPGRLA